MDESPTRPRRQHVAPPNVRAARAAALAAARAARAAALEADREADRANAVAGVVRRVAARRAAARQLDFDPFEPPSPIGTPEPPRKFRRYHDNDNDASRRGGGRRALAF
jgi:hypothetical protein